jgi:CheY-like chemotaxis protein
MAEFDREPPSNLILLVDDSEEDSLLLKHELERAGLANPLFFLSNGAEAIAYLAGQGRFQNRTQYPVPSVLLLDLKMPGLDGFDVLSWIGKRPELKRLLIVVLSGSADVKQVTRAYELGANSYLTKPANPLDLANLANFFRGYWTISNRSPNPARL